MATFTIEADKAAGTPCPETSAINTPKASIFLQEIVKIPATELEERICWRYQAPPQKNFSPAAAQPGCRGNLHFFVQR